MYFLQVEDSFASAHQLRGYRGKCENLHGHNWRVLAKVRGERLDSAGLLLDFDILKKLLRECLARLDHAFLNDIPPFDKLNPTSENIARFLFGELGRILSPGVIPHQVTVWESEKCAASYRGE
ncbi:MAG: 6-carboxytetrahydropterin synthase QueD [Planctomycetes bacterium]|nr:6-carboxytetrahydropterin synthase QueD [Planctomycetota bacterium]